MTSLDFAAPTDGQDLFVPACSITVPAVRDRWLIEGLVGCESVGVVGGDPKMGKSWLVSEIAFAVATGLACLGRFAAHAQGTVLVCSGEGPTWLATDRLTNISNSRGVNLEEFPIQVMSRAAIRLDVPDDQRVLTQEVRRHQPKLLVIDPLTAYHSGDENSVVGLSPVLQYLDGLRRSTGVSVLVVHHTTKRSKGRGGSRLRGTSSLHGWLDSGIYLRAERDSTGVSVEQRCGPSPEDFYIQLVGVEGSFHLEIVEGPEPSTKNGLDEAIVEALEREAVAMPRSTLRAFLKIKNERLTEPLARLERTGVIRRTPEGIELVGEDDEE